MDRMKGWLPFFLAVSIPLSVSYSWYSLHQGYPTRDPGYYITKTLDGYQDAKKDGLLRALWVRYRYRDWKPILHPVLGVFSASLLGGRVFTTMAAYNLVFFAWLLGYLYFLFLFFLPPWKSMLGTLLLGTLPWVIHESHWYMPEIPMLTFLAAFFLHGTCALKANNKTQGVAAGFALGLAICMRPVEAYFLALPFVVAGFRSLKTPVGRFFLVSALSLSVLWYLPGLRSLIDWAYQCTWGTIAKASGQRQTHDFFSYFANIFLSLGGGTLLGVVLLSLGIGWSRKVNKQTAFVFASSIFFLPFIGAFTHNGDLRYFVGSILLLIASLAVLVLRTESGRGNVGTVLVAALVCVQSYHVVFHTWSEQPVSKSHLERFYSEPPADWLKPERQKNPVYQALDGLPVALKESVSPTVGVIQLKTKTRLDAWLALSSLRLNAWNEKSPWKFERVETDGQVTPYDLLVVGPWVNEPSDASLSRIGYSLYKTVSGIDLQGNRGTFALLIRDLPNNNQTSTSF